MNSEITTSERCFKTFKSRVQRFYLQHKSKMWYTETKIKRTLITNNRDRGLYDFVCLFVFNLRFNLDGSVHFIAWCGSLISPITICKATPLVVPLLFSSVHQIPTALKSLPLWMVTFTLWIVASQKRVGLQTDWISISQQLP